MTSKDLVSKLGSEAHWVIIEYLKDQHTRINLESWDILMENIELLHLHSLKDKQKVQEVIQEMRYVYEIMDAAASETLWNAIRGTMDPRDAERIYERAQRLY